MVPQYNEQGGQVLALVIAFTVLATISVFARLFTRIFIVQNVGKDDYAMAVSWVSWTDIVHMLSPVHTTNAPYV